MKLNRLEFRLMNNPLRAAIQRRFEASRLLRLGGPMNGGKTLEIGCGRGVGVQIILDLFHAFDLDHRMVERATRSTSTRFEQTKLWVGSATEIPVADNTYDAVFNFGVIHHVSDWPRTLSEICRVLKPGGRFYAEEVLKRVITNPVARLLLEHPQENRFDHAGFLEGLGTSGFEVLASSDWHNGFGWYVGQKSRKASVLRLSVLG